MGGLEGPPKPPRSDAPRRSRGAPRSRLAPTGSPRDTERERVMGEERAYETLAVDGGVPIKAWIRGVSIEDVAVKQLQNVARLPCVRGWVAAMPDVHWGVGATVGSVIPTVGAIIPAAVGVGNRIGTYFIELAKHDMRQHLANLPDEDLAYLEEGAAHFDDYVQAVGWAQDFALTNRRLMMDAIVRAVRAVPGIPPFEAGLTAVNCHHNYVTRERHGGRELYVTRKGAVRAGAG